jgi:hypothetical protein
VVKARSLVLMTLLFDPGFGLQNSRQKLRRFYDRIISDVKLPVLAGFQENQ